MTLKQWQSSGEYFNYKGHQIFYKKAGSGTPLFLVHGFPTASWDWHKIWDKLAEKHTIYALDMIGFGFSDKPKSYGYSLTDQADLWEVFAEKNGIEKAHILAHDYGDTVVQEMIARFTMRQREQVQMLDILSVTLLNGGILQGGYNPRFIQKFLASPVGPFFYRFIGKPSLRRTFNNIFGDKKATEQEIDEFWSLIEYNNGRRVMPYVIRYLHEREKKKVRWEKALAECPVPLKLINGVEDPISGQNIVNLFKEKVPNGEVIELKGVGHYPQTEVPDLVLEHFMND
jgi:pimeloyl-ACP methyl ester carboxylesterase